MLSDAASPFDNSTARDDVDGPDICRVCRMEGTSETPLHYPCLCTGTIKFVHQECLTQWLKYSKKEVCELCHHKYQFMPVYHPDMPSRLPVSEIAIGFMKTFLRALRCWLHLTLVLLAWFGVVPLAACRVNRCLFKGTLTSFVSLPLDILSPKNILMDCVQGIVIIAVMLCAFLSLIWLREQILHGGVQLVFDQPAQHVQQGVDAVEGDVIMDRAVDGEPLADHPAVNENDDNQWQVFEWDRAAEELTWERLFGFDGSLIFLEHVFWVISLNTLFIVVFAFSPYHVGHLAAVSFRIAPYMKLTYFESLVTTLFGYCVLATAFFLSHLLCGLLKITRAHRALGLTYLMLKVFLLLLVEVGIFPLFCGWWLDVCSLPLFAVTLDDRWKNFYAAPEMSIFLHWLVGMVFVYYFASFILLLREVMRPGVLWFLRNVNDPDFDPIQEMIQFPLVRHIRRFLASVFVFGVIILIFVYCPFRLIMMFAPSVFPYSLSMDSGTRLSSLSLELLFLQVVLPSLLEQGHSRHILRGFIRCWCRVVGYWLDLTEYLLPAQDVDERSGETDQVRNQDAIQAINNNNYEEREVDEGEEAEEMGDGANEEEYGNNREEDPERNLGAAHHALLIGGHVTSGFQPYRRPSFFLLRVLVLILLLCLTVLMSSVIFLTVPVTIGRKTVFLIVGTRKCHELYTLGCGLYICWMIIRLCLMVTEYLPKGVSAMKQAIEQWLATTFVYCIRYVVAVGALFGVVALELGLILDLMIITPLRVPTYSTPVICLPADWALGIFQCKLICTLIFLGPDGRLRRMFQRVYHDGVRNFYLSFFLCNIVLPMALLFGSLLAFPYIIVHGFMPYFGFSDKELILYQKMVYPGTMLLIIAVVFVYWQLKQLKILILKIRNDRYLVGQRLVNCESQRSTANLVEA